MSEPRVSIIITAYNEGDAIVPCLDRVVEAVELAGHPFAIGMRWHPGESDRAKLLERFLAAAAVRVAGSRATYRAQHA